MLSHKHEHLAFKQEKSKFKFKTKPFRASKFKFYWVSAQVPLMKVVDLSTIFNFAFGQFSTSMQQFGEIKV